MSIYDNVPWAEIEALTDSEHGRLVARRVEVNAILRQSRLVFNAIPALADRPWAKKWRARHQRHYRQSIRECEAELRDIEDRIGPPVVWRGPVAKISAAAYARIVRWARWMEANFKRDAAIAAADAAAVRARVDAEMEAARITKISARVESLMAAEARGDETAVAA